MKDDKLINLYGSKVKLTCKYDTENLVEYDGTIGTIVHLTEVYAMMELMVVVKKKHKHIFIPLDSIIEIEIIKPSYFGNKDEDRSIG